VEGEITSDLFTSSS